MRLLRRFFSQAKAASFFCMAWVLKVLFGVSMLPAINRLTAMQDDALFDTVQGDDVGGVFKIELIRDGKHGPVVMQRRFAKNLIVNTGKRQTWRQASGLNTNDWDQMRVGINSVAANSSQTNVITAVTGTLNTVDAKTLLAGTRTMQWVYSLPSGVSSKSATHISEVVLLNQNTSPGGSALSRSVFTPVNKTTADKLKITYRARIT